MVGDLERLDVADGVEDELDGVLTEADSIAILQIRAGHGPVVHDETVRAVEIANAKAFTAELDHGVLTGHGVVREGDVDARTAAQRLARGLEHVLRPDASPLEDDQTRLVAGEEHGLFDFRLLDATRGSILHGRTSGPICGALRDPIEEIGAAT